MICGSDQRIGLCGDSAGFEMLKIYVLAITYHKVGSFSDMSLEHKISVGRIYSQSAQTTKV